eukprot:SAG11_NODE_517_length_8815_cov_35.866797_7_plen_138_part_00
MLKLMGHSTVDAVLKLIRDGMAAQKLRVADAFASIDVDGSGSMDAGELHQLCLCAGMRISDAEVRLVVAALDKDGDGTVDVAELTHAMRKARHKTRSSTSHVEAAMADGAYSNAPTLFLPHRIPNVGCAKQARAASL